MKIYYYLFVLLAFVLLFSCEETTKHTREIAIYGYVIDSNGNPVADADVVVLPELTTSETGRISTKKNSEKLLVVELIQFDVVEKIDHLDIIWQTAAEQNSKKFIIERRTDNSGEYFALDSVDAAGNSAVIHDYSYQDYDVKDDQVYQYRLKLVDTDGSFAYSNPLVIETLPFGVELSDNYPNPFLQYTSISFLIKGYEYYFEIIERSTGKSILKSDLQNELGHHTYNISSIQDGKIRRPGLYDFNLHFGDSVITKEMFLDFSFDESNCEIPLEVTKTDENGYFMITYNYFPDDYLGTFTQETGMVIGTVFSSGYSDIVVRKKVAEDENQITYLLSQNRILVDKTKVEDITCNAEEVQVMK